MKAELNRTIKSTLSRATGSFFSDSPLHRLSVCIIALLLIMCSSCTTCRIFFFVIVFFFLLLLLIFLLLLPSLSLRHSLSLPPFVPPTLPSFLPPSLRPRSPPPLSLKLLSVLSPFLCPYIFFISPTICQSAPNTFPLPLSRSNSL